MAVMPTLKPITISSKQADMMELYELMNLLTYGDQDITCSQDVLAICTRIHYLESRLKNA